MQITSGNVTLIPMGRRFAKPMSVLPRATSTVVFLSFLDCGEVWRYVWRMNADKKANIRLGRVCPHQAFSAISSDIDWAR